MGETNDRIITFFSLGMIVFFTVFVIVASADPGPARSARTAQGGRVAQARRLVGRPEGDPGRGAGRWCEEDLQRRYWPSRDGVM